MRVAVLHNAVFPQDTLEDLDVLVQVEAVQESLQRLGHEHFTVACTLDLDAMSQQLRQIQSDVVFNLVEALQGEDSLIYLPPAVLDALHIPYTGASAASLFLTTHKLLAKQRLLSASLPTPAWLALDDVQAGRESGNLSYDFSAFAGKSTPGALPDQWIIKGVWEQGSRDMDDDAVFSGDLSDVRRRLHERVRRTDRPAFVEQFIAGREFSLALLTGGQGVEVLPPAEIDFSAFPADMPRIVAYRAKWQADAFEYNHTPRRFDFPREDRELLEQLQDLARRCWKLFMLRGWARVDFRVDQNGNPWILEINANPCLSPDAGLVAALQQAGIAFDEAIRRILEEVQTGI
jgi:D-alanine-D-alanine ligase